ncbi:MAG: hypothetical protein ACE5GB_00160 [Acidimicrobiales bacterium]
MTDLASSVATAIRTAHDDAWEHLGLPGAWWSGSQRVAIAAVARAARPVSPWRRPALETLPSDHPSEGLSPFVIEVVERVAVDASRIDRATVSTIAATIGDAAYAELVAVVCQLVAIDQLDHALGVVPRRLPAPVAGEPSRIRPDGMGDVGAHIVMTEPFRGPNVARSLSLAGADHQRWRELVVSMYAAGHFADMVWSHRALARPQIELVATRTSALNECFY